MLLFYVISVASQKVQWKLQEHLRPTRISLIFQFVASFLNVDDSRSINEVFMKEVIEILKGKSFQLFFT